jgi:multidrug efflux pump
LDDRKLKLMGNAPVRSAIIQLALPTMLAAIAQILYNMTDMLFIGMLGDSDLVAAISLAMPLVFVIVAFGNIFGIGAASYISRQLGEKNMDEARHANAVAFYTSAGGGVIICALLLVFIEPIIRLVGSSPNTFRPTVEYFTILAGFGPFLLLQVGLSGLVRSEGATSKAMWGMILGIGSNVILDPIFIFTLGMGLKGAAWATVIGNGLGTLFYIVHFIKGRTVLSIRPRDFKPTKRIYGETFKIGVPAAISMVILSISNILGNIFANGYGDKVVAGFGISMRVTSMAIMLMVGLAQGYQPFAGYNFGAKQYARLRSGIKITMIYSTSLALIFMVVFLLFGRFFVSIFISNDPETVEAGAMFVRGFAFGVTFIGPQMTFMNTFQATGKAVRALLLSLGRQLLVYVPMLLLLNHLFGLDGIVFAQPTADVVSCVAAVLMSISFMKQLHELEHKEEDVQQEVACLMESESEAGA